MTLRHRKVIGLESHAGRVTGVRLQSGETIASNTVVLAQGAWSQEAEAWLGLHVPIYPVRGQLLELRAPEPQLQATLSYQGMYVIRKADGVTLAGATEEHKSGFANHPTSEGRSAILKAVLHLAPSLGDAQVAGQVSGLRPCAADGLPLIGPVPGWQGVYMIAGHFRSGMLLSAYSTRIIAALIAQGQSPIPIDAFSPGRFGRQA
jgi:glycine oxidase